MHTAPLRRAETAFGGGVGEAYLASGFELKLFFGCRTCAGRRSRVGGGRRTAAAALVHMHEYTASAIPFFFQFM